MFYWFVTVLFCVKIFNDFPVKKITKPDIKGAIALITMIILGAVVVMIVSSVTLLGVSSRYNSLQSNESSAVFIKTEGCLEEALLQLSRNNDYSGDSYNIDGADCEVAVSGSGDQRMLDIEASENDFYQHFTVDVQVSPLFGILGFSY
jgi:maltose-binding protein MalE